MPQCGVAATNEEERGGTTEDMKHTEKICLLSVLCIRPLYSSSVFVLCIRPLYPLEPDSSGFPPKAVLGPAFTPGLAKCNNIPTLCPSSAIR